jgi:shikimate dehydrogenase
VEFATARGGRLLAIDGSEEQWPALAVLGDPVAHSLSPKLHAAALGKRGIDSSYEAIRVERSELASSLEAAARAGVRGLNLTLPLKQDALGLVARRTEECTRIGAANTLVLRGGEWMAHNTDARGLAMALERELGSMLRGQLRRCLIVGAGGSARAAACALEALGAGQMEIVARDPARAAWAHDFGARVIPPDAAELSVQTLIVNCTPLGLQPDDPSPVDVSRIDHSAHVLDLTYGATPSILLSSFRGRGQDGRAMLVAQAALAFSIWYGALPPLVEMAAAIGMDW